MHGDFVNTLIHCSIIYLSHQLLVIFDVPERIGSGLYESSMIVHGLFVFCGPILLSSVLDTSEKTISITILFPVLFTR